MAVRADLPIALDFLPCFWKSLCGYQLGLEDLKDADCLTYKLTLKFLEVSSNATSMCSVLKCTLHSASHLKNLNS